MNQELIMYSEVFRHLRGNVSHILVIGLYCEAFKNKFSVMKATCGIIKMF
jgi:hypothetical protein